MAVLAKNQLLGIVGKLQVNNQEYQGSDQSRCGQLYCEFSNWDFLGNFIDSDHLDELSVLRASLQVLDSTNKIAENDVEAVSKSGEDTARIRLWGAALEIFNDHILPENMHPAILAESATRRIIPITDGFDGGATQPMPVITDAHLARDLEDNIPTVVVDGNSQAARIAEEHARRTGALKIIADGGTTKVGVPFKR